MASKEQLRLMAETEARKQLGKTQEKLDQRIRDIADRRLLPAELGRRNN